MYLNNIYPLYKDIYLKEYLKLNAINLYKNLSKLEPKEILQYLNENNLIETDIKCKYLNFAEKKELDDLCLSEKLICLQYALEYFDVTKAQISILIDSLYDNAIEF